MQNLLSSFFHIQRIGAFILILGIVFTTGFANLFWWPIAILALTLLVTFTKGAQNSKQAFMVGFLFGIGHYLSSLYWIPRAFYLDAGENWTIGLAAGVPALLLLSGVLSLFLGFICVITYKSKPQWQGVTFVCSWLAIEILRNLPPISFPWNPLGVIFSSSTELLQAASIGGVFLLSFLALTYAVLLSGKGSHLIIGTLLLAAHFGYGHLRLQDAPNIVHNNTDVRVRLVQGNLPTKHSWNDEKKDIYFQKYLHLTNAPEDIDFIIWPETAVAYAIKRDPIARERIAQTLYPHQKLVLGFLRFEKHEGEEYYRIFNSMGVVDAQAQMTSSYDKHVLVPFGETLPFPKLTQNFLRTLSFNRALYTPGQVPATMQIKENLSVMPLICYEAAFPLYIAQHYSEQKALLNITNDNWFNDTAAPHQHLSIARLRAIETGLPLIRVANTGITSIIDGYGRIVEKIPAQSERVLDAYIPQSVAEQTLFIKVWKKILGIFA